MKVEDIKALSFLLEDELYMLDKDKDQYAASTASKPEIETPEVIFNYLGENKKNFLVLVSYDSHEFMQNEHFAALESVLIRKGYSKDDVAILNVAKHADVGYEQLLGRFRPQILVLLGEKAIPTGMKRPQFNIAEKSNGLKLLYTFSFDEMMMNVENKKAFWEQIKNL